MLNKFKRKALIFIRNLVSDKIYYQVRYFITFRKFLNLNDPKTFMAKLIWLNLYDRKPSYTTLVDKFEVRKYISEKIGLEYLNELYGVYPTVDSIDFDNLPKTFVLKATHGANWILICRDKSQFDIAKAKNTMNKWLKKNFYEMWGEYVYKEVPPRIICERLLANSDEPALVDYKFHCFHGEPKYIQTDRNRFQSHTLDFYDLEWNRLPFGLWFPRSKNAIPKPKPLKKMIELAKTLSKEFKYIRVDFYMVQDKIYFGELTFYPCNGFGVFKPSSVDYEFGKLLKL